VRKGRMLRECHITQRYQYGTREQREVGNPF